MTIIYKLNLRIENNFRVKNSTLKLKFCLWVKKFNFIVKYWILSQNVSFRIEYWILSQKCISSQKLEKSFFPLKVYCGSKKISTSNIYCNEKKFFAKIYFDSKQFFFIGIIVWLKKQYSSSKNNCNERKYFLAKIYFDSKKNFFLESIFWLVRQFFIKFLLENPILCFFLSFLWYIFSSSKFAF